MITKCHSKLFGGICNSKMMMIDDGQSWLFDLAESRPDAVAMQSAFAEILGQPIIIYHCLSIRLQSASSASLGIWNSTRQDAWCFAIACAIRISSRTRAKIYLEMNWRKKKSENGWCFTVHDVSHRISIRTQNIDQSRDVIANGEVMCDQRNAPNEINSNRRSVEPDIGISYAYAYTHEKSADAGSMIRRTLTPIFGPFRFAIKCSTLKSDRIDCRTRNPVRVMPQHFRLHGRTASSFSREMCSRVAVSNRRCEIGVLAMQLHAACMHSKCTFQMI